MLLVSIIIPVFNSEKYIKDTLLSCLEQTYTNFEIIVVNDGSKDNSEAIIKSFSSDKIKYYEIKNSGPCVARNFGVQKANGKLFQFLDADDILEKNKLKKQVLNFLNFGEDYIYSGVMGTIENNRKKLESNFNFYYRNLDVIEYFEEMFGNFGKYYTTGMWLVPKKLIDATHGWNESIKINNDGEYFSRIILFSKGIIFCPEAIFYYRRDVPQSVSKQLNSKPVYESWLYSYKCYVENFKLRLSPTKANKLGRRALSIYYCNSYPNYPELLKECRMDIKDLGFDGPLPYGGKIFQILSYLIGVDSALKLRTFKDQKKKILFS